MSKAKFFLILLALVLFSSIAKAEEAALVLRLHAAKTNFILNEPVYVNIALQNGSPGLLKVSFDFVDHEGHFEMKAGGSQWERCLGTGDQWNSHGLIAPIDLAAHQLVPHEVKLDEYCRGRLTPGKYGLRFVYEIPTFPANHPNHVLWSGRVESPPISIEIAVPTGIDKEAYDMLEACRQGARALQTHDGANCEGKMNEKYPSSTYAAYAFAQQFGLLSPSRKPFDLQFTRSYLQKFLQGNSDLNRMVSKLGPDGRVVNNPDGTAVQITRKQWLTDAIDRAQQACSMHKDLYVCDRIYSDLIAFYYEELLQFEQAAAVLKELSERTSDPEMRANSKQTLEIFHELSIGH